MKDKWMYSLTDNEIWTGDKFDTKEEAINAGKKEAFELQGKEFYKDCFQVGQVVEVSPVGVDVDFILDNVAENTTDGVGEVGDDYLSDVEHDHMEELEEKLNDVLFSWMKKYNYEPDFYRLENIETIKL